MALRSQVTAQVTMLSTRNAEKEALRDEVEALKQDLVGLENELDRSNRARQRDQRDYSIGDEKSTAQLERVSLVHSGSGKPN